MTRAALALAFACALAVPVIRPLGADDGQRLLSVGPGDTRYFATTHLTEPFVSA